MKKFQFSLKSLHKYRGSLEEMSMREFSAGLKMFRESRSRVLRLREERQRLAGEIDSIRECNDKRHELVLYATYIADLKELIAQKEVELKAFKEELESKRLALVEVMKDRKVLDVMREKSLEEFTAQSRRTEQKVMDDIAGTMFSFGGPKNEK